MSPLMSCYIHHVKARQGAWIMVWYWPEHRCSTSQRIAPPGSATSWCLPHACRCPATPPHTGCQKDNCKRHTLWTISLSSLSGLSSSHWADAFTQRDYSLGHTSSMSKGLPPHRDPRLSTVVTFWKVLLSIPSRSPTFSLVPLPVTIVPGGLCLVVIDHTLIINRQNIKPQHRFNTTIVLLSLY